MCTILPKIYPKGGNLPESQKRDLCSKTAIFRPTLCHWENTNTDVKNEKIIFDTMDKENPERTFPMANGKNTVNFCQQKAKMFSRPK